MDYFWLSTRGCSFDCLLLFDSRKDNLTLFSRYSQFVCPECNKVDELAAIRTGLDPSVRVRSRFDLTETGDGFFCVSDKLANLIKSHHLSGVKTMPIPGGRFHALIPTRFLNVNVAQSGMRIVNKKVCSLCKRPRESVGLPSARAIAWPKRTFEFGHPWPTLESRISRHFFFIIGGKTAKLFERSGIFGLSLHPVGSVSAAK